MFKYRNVYMFQSRNLTRLIIMRISNHRIAIGMLFTAVVIMLILSVLTPAFGMKNKIINNTNTTGYGYGYGCEPRTPGYWKNHPESWPVEDITIGDITYLKADAITIMKMPTNGDKTYNMFEQLVAAKLNVIKGCDSGCIDEVIEDADAWMVSYQVGSGVTANSPAWKQGEPLFMMLDDYNNGKLC